MVNHPGRDSRFQEVCFAEVTKDNDDWRKKILPRKHPQDEEPPKVKS